MTTSQGERENYVEHILGVAGLDKFSNLQNIPPDILYKPECMFPILLVMT